MRQMIFSKLAAGELFTIPNEVKYLRSGADTYRKISDHSGQSSSCGTLIPMGPNEGVILVERGRR